MQQLHKSCANRGIKGRTVNLKIRYADFTTLSRSMTLPSSTNDRTAIFRAATEMMAELDIDRSIRLLGIGLSNLDRKSSWVQLEMEFDH